MFDFKSCQNYFMLSRAILKFGIKFLEIRFKFNLGLIFIFHSSMKDHRHRCATNTLVTLLSRRM